MLNRSVQREGLYKKFQDVKSTSAIFLQGGKSETRYNTDVDIIFRQESNFWYITGNPDPNSFCLLNPSTKKCILFVEELSEEHALWCGESTTIEDYKNETKVDEVLFLKDLSKILKEWKVEELFTLSETLLDKSLIPNEIQINKTRLYEELKSLRIFKTKEEIELLKHANKISGEAHIEIMKQLKPNTNECFYDGLFTGHCIKNGMKHLAYSSIVAGGNRGAVLHYVNNDKMLKDGDLLLTDGGCEYLCYASDITRTIPVNGKFTNDQKSIYQIVLNAQKTVISNLKPGIKWVDMHILAEKIICEGLIDLDFIKGEYDELIENDIPSLFFPHGLGHFMGIDVHDPPNRDSSVIVPQRPGIQYLRCSPIFEEGMVITVEPGLYFIKNMLEKAFSNEKQKKFLNIEKIKKFMNFGGIRIEDDILITKNGFENLTNVPKEIEDIEKIMKK
eukprot:gene1529-12655_t